MEKSIDFLVEALKNADGYRNQSLAILEYLESNGVVNCKKEKVRQEVKALAAMAGQNLADDYIVWEVLLKEPSCTEYEDCHVRGAVCSKNMCLNILQAVKEGKIKVPSDEAEAFVSGFISVMDLIFPEGQRDNINVYLRQGEDFGLKFDSNSGRPSLYQIREYRRELFVSLIEALLNSVNMSTAINVFKRYGNRYNLNFRSLFVHLPEKFSEEIKGLSDFDLRYLLAGIDAEQTNSSRRKVSYLRTVKKLCDAGWNLNANTSCINPELLEEISDLNDTFIIKGLNENQRYYLSILVREYDEFSFKPKGFSNYNRKYGDFLGDLRQNVKKILTDRENEYEKRLLEDYNKGENKFDDNELKNLFIAFLKTCRKCEQYAGYESFSYDNINYEALYEKTKKNAEIIKRIAAAQHRFSKVEDIELGEGDFTNLIVVQVKVIERYLKEVIAQNMQGKEIFSHYNFLTGKEKGKSYKIKNNDSANELSSDFSIELATAGYIVANKGWESCRDDEKKKNSFFCTQNSSNFIAWRDSVRNGYFHIHPVETMDKAREIHYKTAFCLMKCIYLLKPLNR